jgi:Mg-chelatase subunit ChlD
MLSQLTFHKIKRTFNMRNDTNAVATDATMETESLTGADDAYSFVNVEASLPEDAVSLKVIPKHKVIGVDANESTTEICMSMTAADLPDDDETRAPVDIIIALDVSGSMNGTPLALCKRTLEMLLRVLLPQDRFGLVTYASEAIIDFSAKKMTATNKEAALVKIKSLHTRGQTNISAAIGLAAFEMQAIENPNDVRSIFLLTDGLANQGVCNVAGLVAITKNCLLSRAQHETQETPSMNHDSSPFAQLSSQGRAMQGAVPREVIATSAPSRPPISMHCFGYGTKHNAELLREIASAASGSYYFVENDTNVGSAFGDCIGGVLSVVAQNAVVTIKPCAEASALGMEIIKVHHDQSIERDNGSHTVTVGDFYAEESRDVLVTVKLARPESPNSTPIPHLSVSLSYTDTLQKCPKQTGPTICSIARPAGSELSDTDTHVTAQWLRVFATEEMAAADVMAQNQDLVGARARIQNVQEKIQLAGADVQSDGMIQELRQSMSVAARGLESVNQYTNIGSKHMSQGMRAYKTQRAAASTPSSGGNYYANKRKKAFAADFKLGEEA